MSAPAMPLLHESLLRLLHGMGGSASNSQMLSAYQARPLSVPALCSARQSLQAGGWLRPGRQWRLSATALQALAQDQRLPLKPGQYRLGQPPDATPPTPAPWRPAFTPWAPPPPAPVREGALDFLAVRSLGALSAPRPKGGRPC